MRGRDERDPGMVAARDDHRPPGKATLTSRLPAPRHTAVPTTGSSASDRAPLADPFGPDLTGVPQHGPDGFGQPQRSSTSTKTSASAQRKAFAAIGDATTGEDIAVAAHRVVEQASLLVARAAAFAPGAASITAVVDTAWLLISVVETNAGTLSHDDLANLASAAAALSGLREMLDEDASARLDDVLGVLAARVDSRGSTLVPSPAAGSPARSDSPIRQLTVVRDAVAARAGLLAEVLRGRHETGFRASMLASETEPLVALLHEAAVIAAPLRKEGPDLAQAERVVAEISTTIALWFTFARANQIGQVASGLDEVFLAEDRMYAAIGGQPPNRRRAFYDDLTAGDWRGELRDDEPVTGKTGGDLIDKIEKWFNSEPQLLVLGISDLATILREPVKAREPSLLEKVIARAVQTFLGMIPAYIGGLVTGAAGAIAAGTPRKPESADMTELRGYSRSPAPPPADAHPELAKLTQAADHLSTAMAPIIGAVGPHHGKAPTGLRGAAVTGDVKDDRPLASAFTIRLNTGVAALMKAALDRSSPLRAGLELIPPAGLALIWDGITSEPAERAAELRAGLVMQWANVVAAATNGLDADGTNAHGGTIEQATEMPGTVQVAATVRRTRQGGATVNVQRLALTGLSASALYELRTAARPLGAIAMHRSVEIDYINEDGFPVRVGTVDFGPAGEIDLSRADSYALAVIGGGTVPSSSSSSLAALTFHATSSDPRATAEAGARFVLASANKTTADID